MVVVTIILLAMSALLLYWYLWIHFSVFERIGIPGPKPLIFFGNILDILSKGQLQVIIEWRLTYGRVFGYFEGFTPVISVSDPEMTKQILVKDFDNFQSRKPFPLAPRKSLGLFLENGIQWKRSRTILSPAFSSSRMRRMSDVMEERADELIQQLCKQHGTCFNIYNAFQRLTLDIIGRCAFGLHTDALRDPMDPFLHKIKQLFSNLSTTVILPLVMLLPVVQYFIFYLKNIALAVGRNPVSWLREQLLAVIRIRQKLGPNGSFTDLMEQMISNKRMNDREIVAQSLTFLLAGYETTSAILAFHCHVLAQHPHVQTKLRREIDKKYGQGKIGYSSIQELPYLNMVFDEVCRLYPTASLIVTRQANNTKIYGDTVIPGGMNVQINVWGLHHDSQYWQDPEKFEPERFSDENRSTIVPYTFIPFGAGPRSCIGSRFAMLETKMAVAKILQKFDLECIDTGNIPLLCRGAIVPKTGVQVKLYKREINV